MFAVRHENNRDEQINLLTPQQLAKLIEPRLSPAQMQEQEKIAPSTRRGVRKAPYSGESTFQDRLPGIDWFN